MNDFNRKNNISTLNLGVSLFSSAAAIASAIFVAGIYFSEFKNKFDRLGEIDDEFTAHIDSFEKEVDPKLNDLKTKLENFEDSLNKFQDDYLPRDEYKIPLDQRGFLLQSGTHTPPAGLNSKFYRCFFQLIDKDCDKDEEILLKVVRDGKRH